MKSPATLFIIVVFLLGLSVFYYFVIFLPNKEANRQSLIESCLKEAHDEYKLNWNKSCEKEDKEVGCSLPSSKAEKIEEHRKELKDDCFRRYPQ